MANPRQRRKSRSSTAKVKTSKASTKNKHKIIVKGPALLTENWDRSKTVRQNYRILGLLPTLNPRQAGGIEPVEGVPFAISSALHRPANLDDLEAHMNNAAEDDSSDDEDSAEVQPVVQQPLAKGQGRIVRDATGKITGIVMGGEDGEDVEETVVSQVRGEDDSESEGESEEEEEVEEKLKTPWGNEMETWSGEESDDEDLEDEVNLYQKPRSTGQGIPLDAKRERIVAKTDIVAKLEVKASFATKVIRHTSTIESDWLIAMIDKYGSDMDKMARDRKVNVWQKTVGEIGRAIKKAGGIDQLKARAARLARAAQEAETAAALDAAMQ